MSSTKFVFFRSSGKTRWPPLPLIGWDIFRLFPWNYLTELNETCQEARSQHLVPSLCFSGWSEKQDGHHGLWLAETFLTSPLKQLIGIKRNCFSGPSGKQEGHPSLWLAETFSTSPLEPLNRIQRNLTGNKISMSSTKFMFFGLIRKTRRPPWPLIGWDIFNFSETTERNSTKLDRKQDHNVPYQVCVFRADWKNKMDALASDWLRHFWLLFWNCLTEFNKTWQEAKFQRLLPSLCFSGRSVKKDGCPGLWLAETISTSPLKPPNGIRRNLTGSKIS